MIQSMEVRLGSFHKVTGVAVADDCVSILDHTGRETLLPVRPLCNPRPQPIQVRGEFGDFSEAEEGEILHGVEATDVTAIDITPHLLRLRTAAGLNLTWELYCDDPGN